MKQYDHGCYNATLNFYDVQNLVSKFQCCHTFTIFFSMYLPFSLTNVITFDIPLPKKIFLQRYTKPHYTQLQKIKVYIKYGRFQKTKSRTHQTKNYVSCHFAQTRYFLNKNINISTTENCVVATMIQKCTFLIYLYDNIFLCTDQSLKI